MEGGVCGFREFCLDVDLKHIGGRGQRRGGFFNFFFLKKISMLQNTWGLIQTHGTWHAEVAPSLSPLCTYKE